MGIETADNRALTPGEIRQFMRDITLNMLRDARFKKRLLAQAEGIFFDIDKEDRKQILKAALKEVISQYKVRDTNSLYRLIMGEIAAGELLLKGTNTKEKRD